MKFEIDFNYDDNDALLEQLGAAFEGDELLGAYFIEIEGFDELEALLKKLDALTNDLWSAVVSFDSPTIYLDNKV